MNTPKNASLTLIGTAMLLSSSVALAQDDFGTAPPPPVASSAGGDNSIQTGVWSLSFQVPGGGNRTAPGAAGIWYVLSPSLNLGANLGLGMDTGGEETAWDILLAPEIRYYLTTSGSVLPFVSGVLKFQMFDPGAGDSDTAVGLGGGIGVEWFITRAFSLAGHTGLGVDLVRPGDGIGIGTLTSALSVQMYFGGQGS